MSWEILVKSNDTELFRQDFSGTREFRGGYINSIEGKPYPDIYPLLDSFDQIFWNDSDPFLETVSDMLVSIFNLDPVVIYIDALESDFSKIQITTASVLGETKDPRAYQPLINCLKKDNYNIRFYTSWALYCFIFLESRW